MAKNASETPLDPIAMVQSLDVELLEKRVATIESEIADYTAGRQRELDALRTLIKAARIARDGKPPRKPRESKKPAAGRRVEADHAGINRFGGRPSMEQRKELADKIKEFLIEMGAAQVPLIAERVRYSESVVESTLALFTDQFVKKHAGYWAMA